MSITNSALLLATIAMSIDKLCAFCLCSQLANWLSVCAGKINNIESIRVML